MDFRTPFHVENQRILDKDGQEVRLWGVNYYAPFNHNYVALRAKGIDIHKAIDRDIEDFRRLGVQLVRMHLFDRELTDMEGTLLMNEHLELLDYLTEKLYQAGIYMMITTMAWWNSTQLQSELKAKYAHTTLGDVGGMGFANFCPKHMLIWHPEFMNIQEKYIRALFSHKNRYSGKTMPEYEHIAIVEVINEPAYPHASTIQYLYENRDILKHDVIHREELLLLEQYEAYCAEHALKDTEENREDFCAERVGKYIQRMFPLVDEYFGKRVLKTHIFYEFDNPPFRRMLQAADDIDLLSLAFYSDLGCYYTPNARYIPEQLLQKKTPHGYFRYVQGHIHDIGKGLICYEWAMTCTLTGFDNVAAARVMASLGIQCASYFTYTPRDLGEYNPGWVMQYLNLYHTPQRAVGFAAAGAVFRQTLYGSGIPQDDVHWQDGFYELFAEQDFSVAREGKKLFWSGSGETAVPTEGAEWILASETCPYAKRSGNGVYILEKVSDAEWHMTVLPDQFYVNDPYHGRNFGGFMNRDMDINQIAVVSRLKESGSDTLLTLPNMTGYSVEIREDGAWKPVAQTDGVFRSDPGFYRIVRK